MKIIFFGTPDYVVPILEELHKTYNRGRERELVAVVTQEPKPVGREKKLEYSAVDHFAHNHKIPVIFDLDDLPSADLGICVAYGKIIPQSVIAKFPLGILNIHPSLLPKYRGASPVQATILSGDDITGVTVIKMDEGMDTGDIVSSFKSVVHESDTNKTLRNRLFEETVEFLTELIPSYIKNKIALKKQNNETATFTKLIKKEDGYIEPKFVQKAINGEELDDEKEIRFLNNQKFNVNAAFIDRFIRALTPWPGVWSKITINDKELRIKILKAYVENSVLIIDEVQLEGKNPVSWEQFKEGYKEAVFFREATQK